MAFLISILILLTSGAVFATAPVFRLHLTTEPSHLVPQKQKSSVASYLLGNLHRNLLYYDNKKGLVPDLAQSCVRKSALKITCELKKDLKWSDGSAMTAPDFLRTYELMLDPESQSPRADLLFSLENAEAIFTLKKKKNTLGVKVLSNHLLEFTLARPDPDFEFHLSSIILSPTPLTSDKFSGPYQLKDWQKGKSLKLSSNKYYVPNKASLRPDVEFLFVAEDNVALQLYEKSQLHFLRRLPTLYISKMKSRADFHWVPMLRMDYVGFGPSLESNKPLRKALSQSLQFEELQKIFSSEGLPGCAGLPADWFFQEKIPCLQFQSQKIKAGALTLMYSAQGGDDHKRAMEWMQNQWRIHLNLPVNLQVKENKLFVHQLETNPPDLFRKGNSLDRPSCLSAVEVFHSSHPENYIRLKSKDFDRLIEQLKTSLDQEKKKSLCSQSVQFLLEESRIIPLGAIHFAMLAKPSFSGWKINQMNQLDLSELQSQP